MSFSYSHQYTIYVFRLSVLFSVFFNFAWSAAISITDGSLTTSLRANGNQCTDNPTWIGTGSTSVDCIGAIQRLYDSEVKSFSDIDFEFLSPKAPARSLPSMRTPRKYTHGECPAVSINIVATCTDIRAKGAGRYMHPRHRNVELLLRRRATRRRRRSLCVERRDVFL